jgi:CBS domain-containing protein
MLEDALATFRSTVGHLMVVGVVDAKLHETVSAIRRTMLSHSFSFLPVQLDGGRWSLISDAEVARFLRQHHDTCSRAERLAMPLSTALSAEPEFALGTSLTPIASVDAAAYVAEDDEANSVLDRIDQRPVLVTSEGRPNGRLVGILTSFDLL